MNTTRPEDRTPAQMRGAEDAIPSWIRLGLFVCAGIATVLGFFGFWAAESFKATAVAAASLQTLQLFVLNVSPEKLTNWAVWVAAFVAPFATLGAGITAFRRGIVRRWHIWQLGRQPAHDLFLGGGDTAAAIAAQRMKARVGRAQPLIVGLDLAGESALERTLRAARHEGYVLEGDALVQSALSAANAAAATHVWITSGDDHRNVVIAKQVLLAQRNTGRRSPRPQVLINLVDPHLIRAHKAVFGDLLEGSNVEFFSMPRLAARALLTSHPPAIRGDGAEVHIAIVGASRLAAALVVHAAQHCVFHEQPANCVRITLIGAGAVALRDSLYRQVPVLDPSVPKTPALEPLLPVARLVAHECDEAELTPSAWETLQAGAPFSVIYVCTERDLRSVIAAARLATLRDAVRVGDQASAAFIITCLQQPGIDSVLSPASGVPPAGSYTFNIHRKCIQPHDAYPGAAADARAELVHDAYLGSSEAELTPGQLERAHQEWAKLSEEFRWSSRLSADHIDIKLQLLGIPRHCSADERATRAAAALREPRNLEAMMRLEHRRFVTERLLDGWLPIAPDRLGAKAPSGLDQKQQKTTLRLNHTLVPFDRLAHVDTEDQKDKDKRITLAIPRILRAARPIVLVAAGRRSFPSAWEDELTEQILTLLSTERVRAVVCSAAAGADLMVLEAAGRLGIKRRVVLPSSEDEFKSTSVTDRGETWALRYDTVLREVKETADLVIEVGARNEYRAANSRIFREAESLVQQGVGQRLAAALIWEGVPREETDWTHSFAREARRKELRIFELTP